MRPSNEKCFDQEYDNGASVRVYVEFDVSIRFILNPNHVNVFLQSCLYRVSIFRYFLHQMDLPNR